jgi:hypothetical protein
MDSGLETVITIIACFVAAAALILVGYLAWRRLKPHRRHRHSRRHKYFGQ